MSDVDVTPKYLESLAGQQDRAAGEMSDAAKDTDGTEEDIWYDHGVLCGHTAQALRGCVRDRKRTGETMKAVSTALAANLRQAAADYSATDEGIGEVLDTQMLRD
jgi:transposase